MRRYWNQSYEFIYRLNGYKSIIGDNIDMVISPWASLYY